MGVVTGLGEGACGWVTVGAKIHGRQHRDTWGHQTCGDSDKWSMGGTWRCVQMWQQLLAVKSHKHHDKKTHTQRSHLS